MARWALQSNRHPRFDRPQGLSVTPVVPLREAFTPTRPQRSGTRFVGRQAELRRIMEVIEDEHAHIVLYGSRGLGKTSLMNKATGMLRAAGYCVGRYFCDINSDYESIMRGLIRDLPSSFLVVPVSNLPHPQGSEEALPQRPIEPGDIASLPSRMSANHVVLVIDEFDRVKSQTTRDRLADTIKQVSDRAANLSFVIIGVSGDLEELIGRYPSIRRSVVGIPLPLLSDSETSQIVADAAIASGFEFSPEITAGIASLAAGSPYLTHLLGLRASQIARARGASVISDDDLDAAIRRVSGEVHPEVLTQHSEHMSIMAAAVREHPEDHYSASHIAEYQDE